MNERIEVPIPVELIHPSFFAIGEKLMVERNLLLNMDISLPFLYEACFFSQLEAVKPWEDQNQHIPLLMTTWRQSQKHLTQLFEQRDKKGIEKPMKQAISLFLELLFWGNGQPVKLTSLHGFDHLKIKPVNLRERLEFILNRPSLYHSFRQLAELMNEMEKHFYKYQALKTKGTAN